MRSVSEPSVQPEASFIEDARRRQIIETAIETIAEVGFNRASLAEIAKRARISKGAILYYFDGKDDLIRQVVVAIYTAGGMFMWPRLEAATTAREALRAYISANVAFMAAHKTYLIAMNEIVWAFRNKDGVIEARHDGAGRRADGNWNRCSRADRSPESSGSSPRIRWRIAIRAAIDMLPPLRVTRTSRWTSAGSRRSSRTCSTARRETKPSQARRKEQQT